MNPHSKKAGQGDGNSVDGVRRGATRPAGVVGIVLCAGFAAAMVAISSCGKPQSQEETQTQPEAAVQNEIQESEQTEVQEPEQAEIPTPEVGSRVSEPHRNQPREPSTATPLSQTNPVASPSMGDQANSPAPVHEDQSYTFSHDLKDETTTSEAVNPTTKVPGRMTVTVTGTFRGKRLGDEQSPGGSNLRADHKAIFSFIPYDRYSPSYSATVGRIQLAGDTTNDSIFLDFGLETTGSDGSSQQFGLREVVTITEDGAQIAFEQRLPEATNTPK